MRAIGRQLSTGYVVAPMTLYLVRHAHAISRGSWEGDDLERPLSPRGRRQVGGLTKMLSEEPIRRIVSSPAVRCVDTVAPLAEARRLTVKHRDELLEESPMAEGVEVVREVATRRGDSVVCCHGDLIPEVLRWLARHGAELEGGDRWAKGSTWVLETEGDRVVRGRYAPPLEG
jgi:8-oxo-dGTP diphosphatase